MPSRPATISVSGSTWFTGAGQGIGLAIAQAFAHAGAAVCLNDIDTERVEGAAAELASL